MHDSKTYGREGGLSWDWSPYQQQRYVSVYVRRGGLSDTVRASDTIGVGVQSVLAGLLRPTDGRLPSLQGTYFRCGEGRLRS